MFKTVDEKFGEIGFAKLEESEYFVRYRRYNRKYDFIQHLDLVHNARGKHIVQSYDTHLFDEKKIGNTCVGLTMYEMKLCIKKMKQMGWKMRKE